MSSELFSNSHSFWLLSKFNPEYRSKRRPGDAAPTVRRCGIIAGGILSSAAPEVTGPRWTDEIACAALGCRGLVALVDCEGCRWSWHAGMSRSNVLVDADTAACAIATGFLGAGVGGRLAHVKGRNVALSATWIGMWAAGSAVTFSGAVVQSTARHCRHQRLQAVVSRLYCLQTPNMSTPTSPNMSTPTFPFTPSCSNDQGS